MKDRNPGVYREFSIGKFTVRKSESAFSDNALDQMQKQMKKYAKGIGGILENSTAVCRHCDNLSSHCSQVALRAQYW